MDSLQPIWSAFWKEIGSTITDPRTYIVSTIGIVAAFLTSLWYRERFKKLVDESLENIQSRLEATLSRNSDNLTSIISTQAASMQSIVDNQLERSKDLIFEEISRRDKKENDMQIAEEMADRRVVHDKMRDLVWQIKQLSTLKDFRLAAVNGDGDEESDTTFDLISAVDDEEPSSGAIERDYRLFDKFARVYRQWKNWPPEHQFMWNGGRRAATSFCQVLAELSIVEDRRNRRGSFETQEHGKFLNVAEFGLKEQITAENSMPGKPILTRHEFEAIPGLFTSNDGVSPTAMSWLEIYGKCEQNDTARFLIIIGPGPEIQNTADDNVLHVARVNGHEGMLLNRTGLAF
ncbi:MAG: hypothetical protein AAFZ74_18645 [Pseudomonadota bacterium]